MNGAWVVVILVGWSALMAWWGRATMKRGSKVKVK